MNAVNYINSDSLQSANSGISILSQSLITAVSALTPTCETYITRVINNATSVGGASANLTSSDLTAQICPGTGVGNAGDSGTVFGCAWVPETTGDGGVTYPAQCMQTCKTDSKGAESAECALNDLFTAPGPLQALRLQCQPQPKIPLTNLCVLRGLTRWLKFE